MHCRFIKVEFVVSAKCVDLSTPAQKMNSSFCSGCPLGETNADCFSRNISPCRNVQGIYNTCNQSMIFFLKCPMIGHTHVCVCYHHSAKTHTAPLIQSPAHGTSCAHVRSNQNRLAAPHGRLTVFPIISRARRNLKTLLPSTIS